MRIFVSCQDIWRFFGSNTDRIDYTCVDFVARTGGSVFLTGNFTAYSLVIDTHDIICQEIYSRVIRDMVRHAARRRLRFYSTLVGFSRIEERCLRIRPRIILGSLGDCGCFTHQYWFQIGTTSGSGHEYKPQRQYRSRGVWLQSRTPEGIGAAAIAPISAQTVSLLSQCCEV
jgi:hypothetical protein